MFEVKTETLQGQSTAIGSAGPFTLVIDRPEAAGGSGLGFNGGQLLYLAVAACISNDLFREAAADGIRLERVHVKVRGDFSGNPAVSEPISYDVKIEGDVPAASLEALVRRVDRIGEIPNSLRCSTPVSLGTVTVERSET